MTAPPVDSEAFRRWFGDSKVVDADGKPLVVYHGTAVEFSAFAGGRGGFYFTNDRKAADEYARHADGEGNPRVVEAYLSIQDPCVLTRSWYDENVMCDGEPDWEIVDVAVHNAEAAGFDGMLLLGFPDFDGMVMDPGAKVSRRVERAYDQWIAFKPEQIKSATGNRGTWDPEDPRICFKREPAPVDTTEDDDDRPAFRF